MLYETIEEASDAAYKLKIKSSDDYKSRYQEDPCLPSNPDIKYVTWNENGSWDGFLKKIKYQTLEQASDAAIALKLTSTNYKAGYKQDPRLPSNPQQYYSDFNSWVKFLGTGKNYYATVKQASKAAIALNITSKSDYDKKYKQDPRLPSSPRRFYSDFDGWVKFLGTERNYYQTLEQASTAAIALKLTTLRSYKSGYKQDPRLHSSPETFYSNFDGWKKFLATETNSLNNIPDKFEAWQSLALNFSAKGKNIDGKKRVLSAFIHEFIIKFDYPERPEAFLSNLTKINDIEYESFLNFFGTEYKIIFHNIVIDFVDFLLKKLCYVEDEDNGGYVYLAGYSNQIKNIESDLFDIEKEILTESNKPPLAFSYVCDARKWIAPASASNFNDLTHLHNMTDYDWYDVDSELIDINDPDCVFRKKTKVVRVNGKYSRVETEITQIWSPVRCIALLTLLYVPLRGQQILWLDSGEADKQIPVINNNKIEWQFNQSELVNLKRKKNEQGFLKKFKNDVGMFITTNKTSRSEKGYSVSWIPDELVPWIIKLRDWQSKYNPLNEPTKWSDPNFKKGKEINEGVLSRRGANCFLFREFSSISPQAVVSIFTKPLAYVLHKIEREDNKLTTVLDTTDNLSSYASEYTPHAMRVSIITAFVMDGDIAIGIVSKLVGHAHIVMTIYYTKVNYAQNKQAINEAEKKALAASPLRVQQQILAKGIESVKSEFVGNNPAFLKSLDKSWPNSAYQYTDMGICPMSGAACGKGGEVIVEAKNPKNNKYGRVPAGHLGERNCLRCRFFITGVGFLGGLCAMANEISLETIFVKKQFGKLDNQVKDLLEEQYECDIEDRPFTNQLLLNKKQSEKESVGIRHSMYIADFIAASRLVNQSIALANEKIKKRIKADDSESESNNGTSLITNSNIAEFSVGLDDTSEFHQLSEICQNAEIFSLASASKATTRKTQILDTLAYNNGLTPMMFRLTEDQQLEVGNQMTRLLLDRYKTWNRVDSVINNDIMLDDLTGENEIVNVKQEFMDILDKSIPSLNYSKNNNVKKIGR